MEKETKNKVNINIIVIITVLVLTSLMMVAYTVLENNKKEVKKSEKEVSLNEEKMKKENTTAELKNNLKSKEEYLKDIEEKLFKNVSEINVTENSKVEWDNNITAIYNFKKGDMLKQMSSGVAKDTDKVMSKEDYKNVMNDFLDKTGFNKNVKYSDDYEEENEKTPEHLIKDVTISMSGEEVIGGKTYKLSGGFRFMRNKEKKPTNNPYYLEVTIHEKK